MTLYTSDKQSIKEAGARAALHYLFLALFTALFGAVYELFSHEVYSYYMIYAFLIPLAGGVLPFLLAAAGLLRRCPGPLSRRFYRSGLITLTLGCILQGVLEIYGTTNVLVRVYWIAGAVLVSLSLFLFHIQKDQEQAPAAEPL